MISRRIRAKRSHANHRVPPQARSGRHTVCIDLHDKSGIHRIGHLATVSRTTVLLHVRKRLSRLDWRSIRDTALTTKCTKRPRGQETKTPRHQETSHVDCQHAHIHFTTALLPRTSSPPSAFHQCARPLSNNSRIDAIATQSPALPTPSSPATGLGHQRTCRKRKLVCGLL